ncbi:alpha/beta hydrolase [Pseudaestuariivita rosea]|uniref:alpha/beta hydrolase n=1 Tax=Pseudaestuariivita rosea TaxID=2763263 RepID=UPI001ABBA4EF|nr:alpha/beta hydrolase [Pseudaestuariivita rosea]
MRFLLIAVIIVLGGCAPRSTAVIVANAADTGQASPIFVMSTRQPDPDIFFNTDRSDEPRYGKYTVVVPPERPAGQISYPTGTPDTNTQFVLSGVDQYQDRSTFRQALSAELRLMPRGKREATIYIHGFNNTFADGIFRIAQLKNDLGIPGVALSFSWASAASPLGYAYDSDSVLAARDALEEMIYEVKRAGADEVFIIAHSMGSLLTMEALRQIAIAEKERPHEMISGVVLISPDIDVDVFLSQVRRIGTLPETFVIFVSARDRALRLSARLTGQTSRLGNLDDIEKIADVDVTLIDVSAFSDGDGLNHFVVGNSPTVLAVLSQVTQIDDAFSRDDSVRSGLLPGTILTVQNATEVILSPTQSIGR